MSEVWRSIWTGLYGAAVAVVTYLAYLLGGWDGALSTMFVAMGLDYFTGIICAIAGKSPKSKSGKFTSTIAYKGLTKKMMMLVIIMVATMLDRLIGTNGVARIAAISFYVANEGMSVVENAHAMGVKIPKGLMDTLKRLRSRGDTAAIKADKKEEENT